MKRDLAAVNIPHRRRGNLDAEIDRNLASQRRAARADGIVDLDGVPHLARGGRVRTWANRTLAERAAEAFGGTAYKSPYSGVFLVHLDHTERES